MTKNRVAICLAVAIALFRAGGAMAQQSALERILNGEEKVHYFYFTLDLGINKTSHKLEVRKDWRQMFLPPSSGMALSRVEPMALGFGLGYNRRLTGNSQSWQIRLPISYQVFSLNLSNPAQFHFAKEVVAGTTLDWWDKVMVNDLVVEHFTPRVGIEIGKGDYAIGLSVQHYRLMAREYLGKDRPGDINISKVIGSRQIESGVSLRADLSFARSHFYGGSMGFYMESMGGFKTVSFGLTAGVQR
ncbi:MAG: hypothetical protein WC619_05330 [Patescibacteria group bacterium]